MDVLRDKEGRSNIRLIILVFVVLSGIAAALLYFPPIPTRTEGEITRGEITFTDSKGNPLSGAITISIAGESQKPQGNVNYVSWDRIPNARIYYNALDTMGVSVNLRISGDSPKGRMILENYAITIPNSVNTTPPGTLVKYVEISATGVSFTEAEISIQYTNKELNGLNESNLAIYRYDNDTQAWSEVPARIDANNKIASATVNSLSIFALSTVMPEKIEVHDTKKTPVVGDIKTYDEAKNVKKAEKASALSAADIPPRGELEVDALKTKNVAVKLKVKTPGSGEIILEDYGRNNPVAMVPPGTTVKYVDISAINVSYDSAEVRIAYTKADLGGADERALIVYHWNGASWDALPTTLDAVNHILTATTTSLSPFAASTGGGGAAHILIATNRYVILDDPKTGSVGSGFSNPGYNLADWNYWNSIAPNRSMTTINATALYIDNTGKPVNNTIITFTFYDPNGNVNTTNYATTNSVGIANVSLDMDSFNFYGKWNVNAKNGSLASGNKTFIYNWWGCGTSTSGTNACNIAHASGSTGQNPDIATLTSANSPYLMGRDQITTYDPSHVAWNCTQCHQSFDGMPGGNFNGGVNRTNNASDVHRNISCTNAGCHGDYNTHGLSSGGNMVIGSCYNASGGCHPRLNPTITNKSTLNSSNVATALSQYSISSTELNATFHTTPNSTVPCIICHGPMHNITKPNEALRNSTDTVTNDSHCTVCHSSYNKHNQSNATSGGVNCTLCHSDDVHAIKVFYQNASGGADYLILNSSIRDVNGNRGTPNSSRGNCTLCHQNGTAFFASLKSLPAAGNYTGRAPPQVPVPLEHSDDPAAGKKWNTTIGYWNNSLQVTWCQYCHGNTTHYLIALGRPSLFDGNNTVNSPISGSTYWCASCHWQGYNGTNTYNDTVSTYNFPNEPLLVPPEITGNASFGANQSNPAYYNHTLITYLDQDCKGCHGSLLSGSANMSEFLHNVAIGVAGGPNCISCHDIGGTATGKLVNFTTMNDSSAIHKNLNSNATSPSGYPSADFRCWACHGNGSEPASGGHPNNPPNRYKTPSRCPDCHVPVAGQNMNYTPNTTLLNVTEHYWNGTDIDTSNVTSCYSCHNRTEMMLLAYAPDNGTGAVYGGANGGNSSTSHYGKKRTDMAAWNSSINNTYCNYCHNTTINNATFYVSDFNNTMFNHTSRPTTPLCSNSTCHNTGRIHNSTLAKPVSNDTLCKTCHGTGGSAATNNKTEHKNLYCTICHANSTVGALAGKDIHAIKYLTQSNNFSTSNSSAVDCTTCHQTSNVDSSLRR